MTCYMGSGLGEITNIGKICQYILFHECSCGVSAVLGARENDPQVWNIEILSKP